MDSQTLFLFALASLALTATPGPDMLLIAARSAAQGRMAGFLTYLGVAAGSFTHALLLALGLSQLFLAVPYAYEVVKYLGAAYLAFLACQAFTARASFSTNASANKHASMWVIFRQGMISNLLNPKVALFFLALFPQFIDPTVGSVGMQVLILALVLNAVGLLVNLTVVFLASSVSRISAGSSSFGKWSRYFLGTVFGGLAAKLVLDDIK